ncbi:MAG TPA: rRNA adenine dimethyltransferase family protein [Nitrososphaerales archaeon]|nr:rRNA adenine dimethyltransferase family protein [Nitrososphaerales archaeon]
MKRHRLGQHYLVDQEIIRQVVSLAGIGPADRVLEIGTGKGALTRELVGLGASYLGFEVDRANFNEISELVRGTRARVVLTDAFEERPEFDVLVSSLPYSESASFVKWLSGMEFRRAVVVLQEDFVRKITARPGSRDYRGITALSQICFDVSVLGRVPRAAFTPQPRVGSVIASFSPRRRIEEAEVANVISLFSLRRRVADSALAELGMKGAGSFGRRRVNSLSPDEVHLLCAPKPR